MMIQSFHVFLMQMMKIQTVDPDSQLSHGLTTEFSTLNFYAGEANKMSASFTNNM